MTTETTPTAHADAHKAHASVKTYLLVAVVLSVVTVIELCIPYSPGPVPLRIALLAILSLAKFATVCAFFMHLFYDSRLLTFLFVFGLLLAIGTLMSTKALMSIHAFEAPPPIVALSNGPKAPLLPPDPKRGKAVFETNVCKTCHTITELPDARGTAGPNLDGVGDQSVDPKNYPTPKQWIEHCITEPNTVSIPGFAPTMPTDIRSSMNDQEFQDLVAYLLTLHKKK